MELALGIGSLGVRLRGADAEWLEALRPRYGRFVSEPAEPFEIELVARGRYPLSWRRIASLLGEEPTTAIADDRLVLQAPSFSAEVDLGNRRGCLTGPLHRAPVDLLLRALLAVTLADGFLCHGALFVDADRAWLCSGPSGAGKSTLAGLLPDLARCDELAAVRLGADGKWEALALPFWHGRPARARLCGIHFLAHGPAHERSELDAGEALRRLMREVQWPTFSRSAMARSLALVGRVASEVPATELRFRPTPDVRPFVVGGGAA